MSNIKAVRGGCWRWVCNEISLSAETQDLLLQSALETSLSISSSSAAPARYSPAGSSVLYIAKTRGMKASLKIQLCSIYN